ncbi:hypothetical protein LEP48_05670 [Isoptericola sp. NEAU-Y5]|uniref:DUF4386 family protein n=1 Tax=Isoptericola luteus TaxID=2879484 RepID=A0ABS7ZD47_9MICO|nr:hypothetical protein [Isoptericola sp. NEAU-Y5]MCA5892843.1 hypothetical protein [Isoptericola sp. NEAU-Y5]
MSATRSARWTASGAVTAAVLLLLFPALRPWPDETVASLALADGFASGRWVAAHLCGIAGLTLLAPTFLGLRQVLAARSTTTAHRPPGVRAASAATWTAWAGAALCALYFGAETFGIRTVAQAALRAGDPAMLADVDVLRNQPVALATFGAGLALLAASGVLVAVAGWHGRGLLRWAGLVVAAGLVLYLPQFFGPPAVRVGHGVLLALGLLGLARAVVRGRPPR